MTDRHANPAPRPHPPSARVVTGFTLIEMLVALFIAAIMFAIGYGTIAQALHNRGRISAEQQGLLALQTTVLIMQQDFVQLAPRPIRSPTGQGWSPALVAMVANTDASDDDTDTDAVTSNTSTVADSSDLGASSDAGDDSNADSGSDSGATPLVQLTRGGWSNPTGVQRPELERVAYVLDHGTLIREHWNVLDPTLSDLPVKRTLLKHLHSVHFRYLDFNRQWVTQWPPLSAGGTQTDSALRARPLAVEITLETRDWGKIVRIIEIGG